MSAIFNLILSNVFNGVMVGVIYAIIAMGMSLIFGVMNIKNLAHGDFAVLGMYTSYWLFTLFNISPLLSIPLSFIIFFGVGMLLTRFLFKYVVGEMLGSILLTFGLSIVLENFMLLIWKSDPRKILVEYGVFSAGPISVGGAYLLAFVLALTLVSLTQLFLSKTKTGIAIRAVSQDAEAAESLGLDADTIRVIGGGLGIALAGCGGAILALIYHMYPYLGILLTLYALIICVLAGLGNVLGTFFGGIIIGIAQSLAIIQLPYALTPAVGFVLFLLVLIFKPKGLFTRG
jgi:branched-chain amino acid transport system permease protein